MRSTTAANILRRTVTSIPLDACSYLPKGVLRTVERNTENWEAEIRIPVESLPGKSLKNCRFNVVRLLDSYSARVSWVTSGGKQLPARLNLAFYNQQEMGRLCAE